MQGSADFENRFGFAIFAVKGNCNEKIPYINGGSDGCRSRMSGNDRAGGWHGI